MTSIGDAAVSIHHVRRVHSQRRDRGLVLMDPEHRPAIEDPAEPAGPGGGRGLKPPRSGGGRGEGGGGGASRRSIRTREEQDAPWRIRVRSAVRLLRRQACPPPPRHLSLTLLFAKSRCQAMGSCFRPRFWAASRPGI